MSTLTPRGHKVTSQRTTGHSRDIEVTDSGRYVIIDGRRWRATDPSIPEQLRAELVAELMSARRLVRVNPGAARPRVNDAKIALGERGEPWWEPTPRGPTAANGRGNARIAAASQRGRDDLSERRRPRRRRGGLASPHGHRAWGRRSLGTRAHHRGATARRRHQPCRSDRPDPPRPRRQVVMGSGLMVPIRPWSIRVTGKAQPATSASLTVQTRHRWSSGTLRHV